MLTHAELSALLALALPEASFRTRAVASLAPQASACTESVPGGNSTPAWATIIRSPLGWMLPHSTAPAPAEEVSPFLTVAPSKVTSRSLLKMLPTKGALAETVILVPGGDTCRQTRLATDPLHSEHCVTTQSAFAEWSGTMGG